MIRLRVERSPGLQFVLGLIGLLLVLAAVDIVWAHRLSTPPHRSGSEISSLGRAQQRADFVWGAVFMVGGGALFTTAFVGLVRRRPELIVRDDGLELHTSGRDGASFVPWEDVASVRSGRDHDEAGSRHRDVLIVEVTADHGLPDDPWGAEWRGQNLHIDADHWVPDVTEVVVHARLALDEHRRRSAG